MTSEQVMPVLLLALLVTAGCELFDRYAPIDPLVAPYPKRQVWAVAPLRNESGSLQADGVRIAELLARQLQTAKGLDVLPVNRVIQAMEGLKMERIKTPDDATRLLGVLGANGLLVGTINNYDSYDPPKIGMAIELYNNPQSPLPRNQFDVRRLSYADTDLPPKRGSTPGEPGLEQPVSAVSMLIDAADPITRDQLERYGQDRGPDDKDKRSWRRYRISMDLFNEFAAYVASWRLLDAEQRRLAPPPATTTKPSRSGS